MKRGCRWRYDSDESTCSNVDSSGWPQQAGVHSYIFLDAWDTSGAYRYPTGDWVLTWEGGDVSLSRGSLVEEDLSSTPKRRVYNIPDTNGMIRVDVNSAPASDVHLWMPGCEGQSSALHPQFVSKLDPFSVLRFMD